MIIIISGDNPYTFMGDSPIIIIIIIIKGDSSQPAAVPLKDLGRVGGFKP
jgi:hypothetical protein